MNNFAVKNGGRFTSKPLPRTAGAMDRPSDIFTFTLS